MKKATALVASAVMATSVAFVPPLQADGRSEERKATIDFCQLVSGGGGRGPNQGRCTAFFSTDDPVALCNELDAFGLLELFGYANRGECIVDQSRDD